MNYLAPFAALLALTAAPLLAQTPGNLTFERWTGISGGVGISMLKEQGISQRPANISQLLPGAATAQNMGDNYGARLRGTFTAPITGNYTFFISSDDNGELWLSETPSATGKRLIARHTGWTGFNVWNKYDTQRSRMFTLQAGQKYYIEALMKEGGGGDHLSIGWSYEAAVALAQTDIGSPVTAAWTENDGTYTASVTSGDIWDNSDHCSTMLRAWSGDGEFITRISGMNNPHEWAKGGIMVRGGNGAGAQNALVALTGSNGMAFQHRAVADSSSSYSYINANAEWIKLIRKGDVLSGHVSADGVTWWQVGSATLPGLPPEIHVGLVASNHGASAPVTATFSHFSASPLTASEVIPASQLTSIAADPLDADGDNLPDAWQSQFAITGTSFGKSEFGDPDNDFFTNLEESQLGTDPNTPDGKPAHWLRERWYGTTGYDVANLIAQDAFYKTPDFTGLTTGSVAQQGSNNGTRLRAILTAPETGDYTFWVSGRGATEFWLSTDSTKYTKQRIAVMGASAGTGHGVSSSSPFIWDTFASQMSAPIHLVAGQQYFLEILGQNGHVADDISLAWAPPGGQRERFDTSHIISYARELTDWEDDYLPDAWETQYGLNPLDNGFADRKKQGERGDYDGDGLSNLEEYLLGTNPANSDTDGDGLGDFEEIHQYGRDPLVSDFIPAHLLSPIDLIGTLVDQGKWKTSGSRLVSSDYRNHASWNLNVPADGIYQVEIAMRMTVARVREAGTAFQAKVGGVSVGRYDIRFGANNKALVIIDLPFLTAGIHELSLDLDGFSVIGSLSLESMLLQRPGGLDVDGNGTADAHVAKLKQRSHLTGAPAASVFSPYIIEGFSPSLAAVSVSANGSTITPQLGVGSNGWKAEISLGAAPLEVVVGFEQGGFHERRTLTWVALDLSESHNLHAREGDTLKFSIPTSPEARVELTSPAGALTNLPLASQIGSYQFAATGTYKLRWFDNGGLRSESVIRVHPAAFGADVVSALKGRVREISTMQDTRDLTADGGAALQIVKRQALANGEKLTVAIRESGAVNLGFRDADSGRLLGLLPIHVIEIADALTSLDYGSFDTGNLDTRGAIYRMAFSDLPEGWTIDVSIFKGGVTFRDGSVRHVFNGADLENGILSLEFLHTQDLSGGLCHRYTIRDASGRIVR